MAILVGVESASGRMHLNWSAANRVGRRSASAGDYRPVERQELVLIRLRHAIFYQSD